MNTRDYGWSHHTCKLIWWWLGSLFLLPSTSSLLGAAQFEAEPPQNIRCTALHGNRAPARRWAAPQWHPPTSTPYRQPRPLSTVELPSGPPQTTPGFSPTQNADGCLSTICQLHFLIFLLLPSGGLRRLTCPHRTCFLSDCTSCSNVTTVLFLIWLLSLPLPSPQRPSTLQFIMQFSTKAVVAIYAALSSILGVQAEEAVAPEDSAVVKLTEATFADFVAENPYVLAEFFAPWCGHCKKLGPEFATAADALADSVPDVKLAQIDCTEERDLCANFEIRGYPTLKVFKGDASNVSDYPGQRVSDSIISYMSKLTLPAVQTIDDAATLDSKIESLPESFILQVLPEGIEKSAANETFYQVADKYKENFTFATTSDKTYVSKYASSGKKPAYVIFRKGEDVEDATLYTGEDIGDDFELLVDFIDVESKPLFGEINGATYQAYTSSNIPLAYYFYASKEERDAAEPIIKRVAKKNRGEINFVGLDASQFGMHAQNLNMQEDFPLFVIHDLEKNKKYGIPQDKPLDNNDITQFVQKFKAGEVEPIVKSEPIPEKQESSVYHLVGTEHDSIVNSKKDVFVKYYAPWCGHCKKLAPIFEDLAEKYVGRDVVVAELDNTLNDVEGVEIHGYPTLVLFPADGSDPIYYEEARTLEAMANFIKENGSLKIDAFDGEEDDAEEVDVVVEETAAPVAEEAKEEAAHDEL